MIIVVFSLLFLAVFLITRSYRYAHNYYGTILYVSLMSITYSLICTDYALWSFPVWWIFTSHATVLFQALVLFPTTTVVFLRYLPTNKWLVTLYILLYIVPYIAMEWLMMKLGQIRYGHGWNLGWSTLIVFSMFVLVLLHERSKRLTWTFTMVIIVFLVRWFDVPLLAL